MDIDLHLLFRLSNERIDGNEIEQLEYHAVCVCMIFLVYRQSPKKQL